MKTYKTQKEFEADIKDGVFVSLESIDITAFQLNVEAIIKVTGDINARDINAGNINARDINAGNINARDIDARDINARDIDARDINARDITAWNIDAWNINAKKIEYYAVAFAYNNIRATSIKGTRENSRYFVLDGTIEIEGEKVCEK